MSSTRGDFRQANQGLVVETFDGTNDADGGVLDFVPEEPFESQGRSDGIGIRIDGDQHTILVLKREKKY